jgi:hypothetical protein
MATRPNATSKSPKDIVYPQLEEQEARGNPARQSSR